MASSGFGLSRAVSGVVDGVRETENRRDRETNRNRQQVNFDQQQSDRTHALGRRDINESRQDLAYDTAKADQDRFREGNDLLRQLLSTGDVSGFSEYGTKYSHEGMGYDLKQNDKGGYEVTVTKGDKSNTGPITVDEIGKSMQVLMHPDTSGRMDEQASQEAAAKSKQDDQAHDINLKRLDNTGKIDVQKLKNAGAKGKGSKHEENMRKHMVTATKYYDGVSKTNNGSQYDGIFSFDNKTKVALAGDEKTLSMAMYRAAGVIDGDMAGASNDARRYMVESLDLAKRAATKDIENGDVELKDGQKESEAIEARTIEYMNREVDRKIADLGGMSEEESQPEIKRESKKQSGDKAAAALKEMVKGKSDNEIKKIKAMYDKASKTPGSADKILGKSVKKKADVKLDRKEKPVKKVDKSKSEGIKIKHQNYGRNKKDEGKKTQVALNRGEK